MSKPQLDFDAGAVIAERYRIEKGVGRGGYGTVYRAVRLADGARVALKIMHMRHAHNAVQLKRFQREAATVTRLKQKNVVSMLDYGHTPEGLPFIVFELLRGHSLKYRLNKEGALSVWRCGQIAIQALRALEAAHALQIAHRDIKPANIYLCAGKSDDFVKVLDFGIAKALVDETVGATKLTQVGQMIGSPAYMSPEQVKGGDIGLTGDLYSLGLVMAEVLSGKRVVTGRNDIDVFTAHLKPEKHPLSEAVRDSGLGYVVARAIEKSPADRYQSAAQMLADVEAALHAEYERQQAAAVHVQPQVAAAPTPQPTAKMPRAHTTPMPIEQAPLSGSIADLVETVRMSEKDAQHDIDEILRRHGVDPATGKRMAGGQQAGIGQTVAIVEAPQQDLHPLEATVPQRPADIDNLLAQAASRAESRVGATDSMDAYTPIQRPPPSHGALVETAMSESKEDPGRSRAMVMMVLLFVVLGVALGASYLAFV